MAETLGFEMFAGYGFFPRKVILREREDSNSVSFFAGLYLFAGPTAKGKTLNSLGLGLHLRERGTVRYIHANEATGSVLTIDELMSILPSRSGSMLIVDSMTLPLMLVQGDKYGSFQRGLNPGHIEALSRWQHTAYEANVCLVAVLNSDLFPVGDLEGAAEGSIAISSFGNLKKRDRGLRQWEDIALTEDDLRKAKAFAFYKESGSRGSSKDWGLPY